MLSRFNVARWHEDLRVGLIDLGLGVLMVLGYGGSFVGNVAKALKGPPEPRQVATGSRSRSERVVSYFEIGGGSAGACPSCFVGSGGSMSMNAADTWYLPRLILSKTGELLRVP